MRARLGIPIPVRRAFVLAWVAATLALATALGAATRSGEVVLPWLRRLGLGPEASDAAHILLRKGGHVLAYAGFALLVRWALTGPARARWALLAALALALADESLQAASAGRGASAADVLLDTGAAALALAWITPRRPPAPAPHA